VSTSSNASNDVPLGAECPPRRVGPWAAGAPPPVKWRTRQFVGGAASPPQQDSKPDSTPPRNASHPRPGAPQSDVMGPRGAAVGRKDPGPWPPTSDSGTTACRLCLGRGGAAEIGAGSNGRPGPPAMTGAARGGLVGARLVAGGCVAPLNHTPRGPGGGAGQKKSFIRRAVHGGPRKKWFGAGGSGSRFFFSAAALRAAVGRGPLWGPKGENRRPQPAGPGKRPMKTYPKPWIPVTACGQLSHQSGLNGGAKSPMIPHSTRSPVSELPQPVRNGFAGCCSRQSPSASPSYMGCPGARRGGPRV